MMKNLLLTVSLFLISIVSAWSAGTINVTTLPASVGVGEDAQFVLEYTSDVACSINIAIFKSQAGSDDIDWGTYVGHKDITGLAVAATATEINFDYAVGSMELSSDLPDGIKYIWALKIVADSDQSESGYSNSGATNSFVVTAPTSVTNWIHFTSTPAAEIEAGQTDNIQFEYLIEQDSKLKVSVTKYTTSWGWVGDEVATYSADLTAHVAATPTAYASDVEIPLTTAPTADLTDEMYKWEVTILDMSNGYVTSLKSDIIVLTTTTGVDADVIDGVSVFPNPVKDVLNVNGLTSASQVQVVNISGSIVKTALLANSNATLDVADLANGVYFLLYNDTQVKFVKK